MCVWGGGRGVLQCTCAVRCSGGTVAQAFACTTQPIMAAFQISFIGYVSFCGVLYVLFLMARAAVYDPEFFEDKAIPMMLSPATVFEPQAGQCDRGAPLFGMHTWISLPNPVQALRFAATIPSVMSALHAIADGAEDHGGLIAFTQGTSTTGWKWVFETVTVWRCRQDMLRLFRHQSHQEAMKKFAKNDNPNLKTGFRRFHIRREQLPPHVTTRQWVRSVKGDEFEPIS